MGYRILIIKLAALGDVIRTEALLPGLKAVHPQSHITWVSSPAGCRVLANNPLIDRSLEFNAATICQLQCEQFDLLLSLDKEPAPAALATRVLASTKKGMGLSTFGTVYPLNPEAHHYFALGLSDKMKFEENSRSYQQLIYQAVGLEYRGERYQVYPSAANAQRARQVFEEAGVGPDNIIVGLNTGAGTAFANKTWSAAQFAELGLRLLRRGGCTPALLGGPQEEDKNRWIAQRLGPGVIHTGCHHSELDFAAIVRHCAVVVTGDTTAMHLAIALRIPVVVLFGPTCSQEIDLYGRGVKLISRIPCAPCYQRQCNLQPSCMEQISVDEVERALRRFVRPAPAALETLARPVKLIGASPER